MVSFCCAFNCSATSDVYRGLRFHGFPMKNPELLKKWINALKRKDFKPSSSTRICSSHFKPTDYDPPVICGPPRLKKDAVPSVFDLPDDLMPEYNYTVLSVFDLRDDLMPEQNNRLVLQQGFSANISENVAPMEEEPNNENTPAEEVVKRSHEACTQTTLTGEALLQKLNALSKENRLLRLQVSRKNKKINNLKEMLKLLKSNGRGNDELNSVMNSNFSNLPSTLYENECRNLRKKVDKKGEGI